MQLRPKLAAVLSAALAAAVVSPGVDAPRAAAATPDGTASEGVATTTTQVSVAESLPRPGGQHQPQNPQPEAVAAAGFGWIAYEDDTLNYFWVDLYWNGIYAGEVAWSRDPGWGDFDANGSLDPGDALIAFDDTSDGDGVEGVLSTGRIASTRGHSAPYSSGWVTGNLPEGNAYNMWACLVQGSWYACAGPFTIYA
jgi:hypothetical protein